jgi:hypothetical protein
MRRDARHRAVCASRPRRSCPVERPSWSSPTAKLRFSCTVSGKIVPTGDPADLQTALMQSISDQAARVSAAVYWRRRSRAPNLHAGRRRAGIRRAGCGRLGGVNEYQSPSIHRRDRATNGWLSRPRRHQRHHSAGSAQRWRIRTATTSSHYTPAESTFNLKSTGHPYHQLRVRVRRPDLTVRSRTGFYAVANDAEHPTRAKSKTEQLGDAIASPFAGAGVRVRVTPGIRVQPREEGCHSLFRARRRPRPHVHGRTRWVEQGHARHRRCGTDGSGAPIDQKAESYTIRITRETLVRLQAWGLVHSVDVPVKKDRLHQLESPFAMPSPGESARHSSASPVPDVGNGKLCALERRASRPARQNADGFGGRGVGGGSTVSSRYRARVQRRRLQCKLDKLRQSRPSAHV